MSDEPYWPADDEAELEAGIDFAAALLANYNRDTGTWAQPRTGEFWDAVRDAHQARLTGRGVTVAVIDGGFDVTVPALADCTPDRDDGDHTSHGTAVALLVKEVAPDSRLLLYTVTREGKVDKALVTSAVQRAVADGADVINLSLGFKVEVPESHRYPSSMADFVDWRARLKLPPHPVVDATAEALRAGVTVVAACGNRANSVLLPAAHPSTLSVGFLTIWRMDDGGSAELSGVAPEGYQQSPFADIQLTQPQDVLGSSFASPQFAGFAAISPHRASLRDYSRPMKMTAVASDLMIGWSGSEWDDAAARIDGWFKDALWALPHRHPATHDPCPTCALLAAPSYLNWGLWRLRWGYLDTAEGLFRAVIGFAPSNSKAKANLAVTLATRAERGREGLSAPDRAALYEEAAQLMGEAALATPEDPVLAQKAAEYRSAAVAFRP